MTVGKIAVIGTGYVGLTSGACLASLGHQVVCGDVVPEKVASLSAGHVPILEDGLDALVAEGLASGNLSFVLGADVAVKGAKYIFLSLPTPDDGDGRADLSIVRAVAKQIGPLLEPGAIVITKSTVPVGTAKKLEKIIGREDVALVSNPEFLQEGTAVKNFMKPDRVVVGSSDLAAAREVGELYASLGAPLVVTSAESSEMIKYAANAFLAMKLSFVNSIAALAEEVGADIQEITRGMKDDPRIGDKFLKAGPGWGGSCFPKDTNALAAIADDHDIRFPLLDATVTANRQAKDRVVDKIRAAVGGDLEGKTVALWGLTFKAGTDDLRDSPALLISKLLAGEGALLRAYDPTVHEDLEASARNPEITVASDPHAAAEGADVIALLTEWPEFADIDLQKTAVSTRTRTIVDGRNMLSPEAVTAAGFTLIPLGRQP